MEINCPICNSAEGRYLFSSSDKKFLTPGVFKYFECSACEVWHMSPQPDEKVLKTYYPENYYSARSVSKQAWKEKIRKGVLARFLGYPFAPSFYSFFLKTFLYKLFSYPRYVFKGSVLDVGCGQGYFLNDLQALGWNVYGIDTNKNAVDFCNKTGLKNVTLSSIDTASFPDNRFDAITMVHVLEHVQEPVMTLQRIKKMLKPGGELVITVPNHSGFSSKLFKSNWFGLEAPRHLYVYNRKSLIKLLQKTGFSVEKTFTSNSFGDFSQSLLYAGIHFNPNFLSKLIYYLGFFLDPALSRIDAGDQITARARKK